ncbi:MAG TPA: PhnD/SsuA/transferrin family substrate-binding protein [Dongiaceae bacterium]|nr:PhnD/SsuA/transferrin family substrate-binding protein [Dongiaceae bacterium]
MRTAGAFFVGLLCLAARLSAQPAAPVAAPATPSTAPVPEAVILVVAPGFPGTTAQAQPTMDLFAKALSAAAGRPAASLATAYFESEAGGLAALAKPAARYALVPLPYYLKHAGNPPLTPRLLVEEGGGTTQIWSLAAARGQVHGATGLAGWELTGTPGYSPGFVRMALAAWGALPADTRITPTAGILSALRRAAAGDAKVAVLLDRAQTAALPSLPFASSLEIVATSPALPSTLFCTLGKAAGDGADPVPGALLKLHETREGAAALTAMRITRFQPLDPGLMPPIRAGYAAAIAKP